MTVQWTEMFNCYTAKVGFLTLHVDYQANRDRRGYRVRVQGANVVELADWSPSVQDGKDRAIKLARQLLREALLILAAQPNPPAPPEEPTKG